MAAEVRRFRALLEHMDQDKARAVAARVLFHGHQVPEELSGKRAAEVAKKENGEGLLVRGVSKRFAGGEVELQDRLRERREGFIAARKTK